MLIQTGFEGSPDLAGATHLPKLDWSYPGEVISALSGARHTIHEAAARGGRNTLKLEIPEMRDFTDPVARFERSPEGIVYEAYDVGSTQGNQK